MGTSEAQLVRQGPLVRAAVKVQTSAKTAPRREPLLLLGEAAEGLACIRG